MISVKESAQLLGVSTSRVRALIDSGALPAQKHGRFWMLREEDVMQRVFAPPKPGRPKLVDAHDPVQARQEEKEMIDEAHEAYRLCRKLFKHLPSMEMMRHAESQEEASFYMAASDFFLREKQAQVIANGVF